MFTPTISPSRPFNFASARRALLSSALIASLLSSAALHADFQSDLDAFWTGQFNDMNWQLNDPDIRRPQGEPNPYYAIQGDGRTNTILRRTRGLLEDLMNMPDAPDLADELAQLEDLEQNASDNLAGFKAAAALQRQIALKNPLLDFDEMVFTCYETKLPQFHSFQMAWFALQDSNAGLYKVSGIKSGNPQYTDLLQNAVVTNGRFKGKILSNKNPEWGGGAAFFTPEVSYDADKIMFAWAPIAGERNWGIANKYDINTKFRIFEMNMDGTELRMLTDFLTPELDEYDPLYLPNGRIAWVSERHNGGQRCGNTATSGNLYSMKPYGGPDNMGSDIVRMSWHETNERSPTVDYNGKLIYSRWDYIDRHAYSAQNMWTAGPDGTDPRSYHGNYIEDTKPFHPISQGDSRPIPGAPGKYATIVAGHHDAYIGPLAIVDVNKRAKYEEQIRWFWEGWELPGDFFRTSDNHPKTDKRRRSPIDRQFQTPYPLNEDYIIVAEGNDVLLVDKFRNEILLFNNTAVGAKINIRSPLPIKPRKVEPVLLTRTFQGERRAGAPKATISVMNVYETDTPFPPEYGPEEGMKKFTHLRVNQIIGRPKLPWGTLRNIFAGWSDGTLIKAMIGTVPIEPDGSAYFEAPIEREIYFQLLNEEGQAVQSMLSGTYVHPGEHLSCVGCHEDKWKNYVPKSAPLALRREPSPITPGPEGTYPLTYARTAEPVFQKHCVECHATNPDTTLKSFAYWDESRILYNNNGRKIGPAAGDLHKYVRFYHAAYKNAYDILENDDPSQLYLGFPGTTLSRSIPGGIGALGSEITQYLDNHHGVNLTDEEKRIVYIWLDLNAQNLGTYQVEGDMNSPDLFWNDVFQAQRDGEEVWPAWEHSGMDPNNPTGVQID